LKRLQKTSLSELSPEGTAENDPGCQSWVNWTTRECYCNHPRPTRFSLRPPIAYNPRIICTFGQLWLKVTRTNPDFLCSLVESLGLVRLSVKKAAYADVTRAACRKRGMVLGGPPEWRIAHFRGGGTPGLRPGAFSAVPAGLGRFSNLYPGLTSWATLSRPYGTQFGEGSSPNRGVFVQFRLGSTRHKEKQHRDYS
jgi:hypothetical protein